MAPPQTTRDGSVALHRVYGSHGHRSFQWSQPQTTGEGFPVRRVYKRHLSTPPFQTTRGGVSTQRVYGGHRSSLVWRRESTGQSHPNSSDKHPVQQASDAVKDFKGARAGEMIATGQSHAMPATPKARPSPVSHCSAHSSHFVSESSHLRRAPPSNPTGLQLEHSSGGTSPFGDGASASSFHPSLSSRAPKTHVLNNLQSVEVYFHSGKQITAYTVSMRSIFTAQAVLQELQSLLPLSDSSRELRLLELYHGEKFKVFSSDDIVQFQLDNKKHVSLHAERVPEFEDRLEDDERILQIFRIIRNIDSGLVRKSEKHYVIYSEGDTIAMVKEQLQEDFEVPDSCAEKWKFSYMSHSRDTSFPLQDAHIVSAYFQKNVSRVWAEYLLWEDFRSPSEDVEDTRDISGEECVKTGSEQNMKKRGGDQIEMKYASLSKRRETGPTVQRA